MGDRSRGFIVSPVTADRKLLERTLELAAAYLDSLPERPVGPPADLAELRAAFGGELPETGDEPLAVVEQLAAAAEPGIVANAGPRYFGFVIGGSLPAALAADWLAAAWDQNAVNFTTSPAAAVVEEGAARWLLDVLGLPPECSVGFVTGGQTANFTCLAAARHAVLAGHGWDVARGGLQGAPVIRVVAGEDAHVTLFRALRLLGLGDATAELVPVDDQGRMSAPELECVLAEGDGPLIVCAQAGNVNSGGVDPLRTIAEHVRARGGWLHVDGAFGLWAAASPSLRSLVDGLELADSWAVDAHKWLNVPYDSGIAIVRDAAAHDATTSLTASYLPAAPGGARDPAGLVPESSRRARGFAVWAALRSLGRTGTAELVDRCCAHARSFAAALGAAPGVEILNDVVLNQVLVRFDGDDQRTRGVVDRVQRDGTLWLGPTVWRGAAAMRISVSSWQTTDADVARSTAAILAALEAERAAAPPG
jgi:glutamate/tyrosine decarboxylase-like PLP-dependent enzyme